jgi:hypothetical protein
MPSIFIWKANVPNTSKKYIRYYSGSNWFLEDNDYSTSYMYLQQIVIPECDDSVITFHVKKMPTDWVGADLLEVNQVSITTIKNDDYGTLDHIGNWMRFISKGDISFTKENLIHEFQKIKDWKENQVPVSISLPKEHTSKYLSNRKSTNNYNVESNQRYHTSHHRSMHYHHPPSNYHEAQIPLSFDTESVHQNFKHFLHKFNMNNLLHNKILHNSHTSISIPIVSHTNYR